MEVVLEELDDGHDQVVSQRTQAEKGAR